MQKLTFEATMELIIIHAGTALTRRRRQGTGGSIYQVFAYNERIEKGGTLPKLRQDIERTKRFGVGFDGTREGQSVTYQYMNTSGVKRQLLEWGYK